MRDIYKLEELLTRTFPTWLNHKLLKLLKSVLPTLKGLGKKFAMFLLTMTEPSAAVDS